MKTVMIRLVLTLTSPNGMPIQIDRLLPIAVGRNLDGSTIPHWLNDRETSNECVLEVDLDLPSTAAFEFPSQPVKVSLSRLAPDGTLAVSRSDATPQPKSKVYTKLESLGAKYTSRKTNSSDRTDPPSTEQHI